MPRDTLRKEAEETLNKADLEDLDAFAMRKLPALLEEVGSLVKSRRVSVAEAFDAVGKDVMLCDKSKILWMDEEEPRSNQYWSLFNSFAAEIRAESTRRTKAAEIRAESTPQPKAACDTVIAGHEQYAGRRAPARSDSSSCRSRTWLA